MLAAKYSVKARNMLLRYASLLEPELYAPPYANGIWLIRPDGYVAVAAQGRDWTIIDTFLSSISVKKHQ